MSLRQAWSTFDQSGIVASDKNGRQRADAYCDYAVIPVPGLAAVFALGKRTYNLGCSKQNLPDFVSSARGVDLEEQRCQQRSTTLTSRPQTARP